MIAFELTAANIVFMGRAAALDWGTDRQAKYTHTELSFPGAPHVRQRLVRHKDGGLKEYLSCRYTDHHGKRGYHQQIVKTTANMASEIADAVRGELAARIEEFFVLNNVSSA